MRRFILCFIASVISATALAHPHSWVQLTTDFAVDESGQLSEIRQRWIFDTFYSALSLTDLATEYGDDLDKGLSEFASEVTTNLANVNYFSNLVWQDQEIDLDDLQDYRMQVFDTGEERLLVLEMSFAISDDIYPEESPLRWSVYDPTYYVSFMHNSNDYVRVQNSSSAECEVYIEQPDVAIEWVEYAESLDKTQRDTDGLGQMFAEWVDLKCI